MARALLGVVFLVFGSVSVWDAQRIAGTIRRRGTLDMVGPDGYLLGVAILMLALGAMLVIGAWIERRRRVASGRPASASDAGYAHLALIAALFAYAAVMPVAGYVLATLAFLTAVFRIMGTKRWAHCVIGAVVLTALFYFAFTQLADLPLPRGWHGLG